MNNNDNNNDNDNNEKRIRHLKTNEVVCLFFFEGSMVLTERWREREIYMAEDRYREGERETGYRVRSSDTFTLEILFSKTFSLKHVCIQAIFWRS